MADVAWEHGPYRVEYTGDPEEPYRYMYTPAGGIPFKLTIRDPEMQILINALREDPQKEAIQDLLDDLNRRGLT